MIEFAAPIALVALLSVPLILYLYRLRPRRRERTIASLELWKEAIRRRRPSNGLARLLRNFSLLLLLATALLLALSLADPKWLEMESSPPDLILVVDASASMQSSTRGSTRFAAAIDRAGEMLSARPEGARTALISSARRARLEVPFTTNRSVLSGALAALIATHEVGQPERALALAASLQSQHDNTQIVLFTDGAFAPSEVGGRSRLNIIQVGEAAANVGITRFQVRAHPRVADQYVMFARIHNFAEEGVTLSARLEVAGATVQRFDVDIPGNSQETLSAEFGSLGGERTTLVLEHDDALAIDDQAYAVLPTRAPLLVSVPQALLEDEVFLASALEAMPHIGVVADALEDTADRSAPTGRATRRRAADIVITRNSARVSSSGNFLVFGAGGADSLVKAGAQVNDVGTIAIRNPLFGSGLDLSDIRVGKATLLRQNEDSGYRYEPLLRVAQGDIAAALLGRDARVVVFGFSPGDTSMPMRPAWPILLDDALTWLAGQTQPDVATAIRTGHSVRVAAGAVTGQANLTTPSGEQRSIDIIDGEAFIGNANEAGFYTLSTDSSYQPFAANLASARESDVRPQVGTTVATSSVRQAQSEQTNTLWPWLLLLALAALAWETWLRAATPLTLRGLWHQVTAGDRGAAVRR